MRPANLSPSGPLDRRTPPEPGTLRPFRFPSFERFTLGNGLELLVARTTQIPVVDLHLVLPAGGQYSPASTPGLAGFHADLLEEGTEQTSALDLARRIERLGGRIGAGADWDVAAINVGALSANLPEAIELLAEVVRTPAFADEDIERIRRYRKSRLLRRADQPASSGIDTFSKAAYPDLPYGLPILGTTEGIEAVDRETLVGFNRDHRNPADLTLIVVGDVEAEDLRARLESAFGDLAPGATLLRPTLTATPLAATRVIVVDRPSAAQTQLVMGHASVPRSEPGHMPRMLMSAVLGGSFTSRLNTNLRERHGYTYGVSSRFAVRQGPGPFVIRAAIDTAAIGHAVEETFGEIRRLQQDGVEADELQSSKTFLAGIFATGLQSVDQISQRLESMVVHDLDEDHLRSFHERLERVDAEAVLDAARRHVHPDQMLVVAVGPASELVPQLERFGPLETVTG